MAEEQKAQRLTSKQRAFVNAFIGKCRGNATRAAEEAGYSDPEANGGRVRDTPVVAAEIERLLEENAASKAEVLSNLTDWMRGPSAYFIPMGTTGAFDLDAMARDGKAHLIAAIKEKSAGENGTIHEVEFHDAHAAARDLARIYGLDKGGAGQNVVVTVKILSGVSMDEI